jgi:hypothetical protein
MASALRKNEIMSEKYSSIQVCNENCIMKNDSKIEKVGKDTEWMTSCQENDSTWLVLISLNEVHGDIKAKRCRL